MSIEQEKNGQCDVDRVLADLRAGKQREEHLHRVGSKLKFIDLFCGIGGFRFGLEEHGMQCVWSCDINPKSRATYKEWFGEEPHGDIYDIAASDIPDADIICGGFPCQPFSKMRNAYKNRLKGVGLEDPKDGNLFFRIMEIVDAKRPRVVFLENVRNLAKVDDGKTFALINKAFADIKYTMYAIVYRGSGFIPQSRSRVYIVAFRDNDFFTFPHEPARSLPSKIALTEGAVEDKYYLTNKQWKAVLRERGLQKAREKKWDRKFDEYGHIINPNKPARCIMRTDSSRYMNLVPQIEPYKNPRHKHPRFLTEQEMARLMGFSDALPFIHPYRVMGHQFGNAISPVIVKEIAREIVITLARYGRTQTN